VYAKFKPQSESGHKSNTLLYHTIPLACAILCIAIDNTTISCCVSWLLLAAGSASGDAGDDPVEVLHVEGR